MALGALGALTVGVVALVSGRSHSATSSTQGGASPPPQLALGTPPPPLALKPRLGDGSVLAQLRFGAGAAPIEVVEGVASAGGNIGHDSHSAYPGEPHTMLLVAGPGAAITPPPLGSTIQVSATYGVFQYRVDSDAPLNSAASAPDAPELRLSIAGSSGPLLVTAQLVPGDAQSAAEIAEEVEVAQAEQSAVATGVPESAPGRLYAPVSGPVSQEFGPTDLTIEFPFFYQGVFYAHFHTGIDIAVPLGTPVRAAQNGVVVLATTNVANGVPVGFGTYIVISHGGGLYTLYGHLSQLDVRVGQRVGTGDVIGLAGSTGNSTGPHLHFEVRLGHTPIDPRSLLAS